jgi:hypothetical protein
VNILTKFEKKKKKTLLVTIFFTTKNIFILIIYIIYVFLNIHIDDHHFSNIAKLKKRTKTAQALPQQGFCPFFPHHNAYSSKRAPLLYMSVTTLAGEGGGGWKIIVCSVHNKVIRKVTMSFTGYLTPNQFFHPEFHRVSHTQPVFPP